ncbi:MAG TPA: ABC transporter permease [Reyranella sp.]|nr:ABC transporter permease [Reyranella sp.]
MTGALRVFVKELRELWEPPRPIVWILLAGLLLLGIVGNLRLSETQMTILLATGGGESAEQARTILGESANLQVIVVEDAIGNYEQALERTHADIGVFWEDRWLIYERIRHPQRAERIHAAALQIAASLHDNQPWQVSFLQYYLSEEKQAANATPVGIVTIQSGNWVSDKSLVPAYIAFVILFVPFVMAAGTIAREEEFGTIQPLLIAPGVGWLAVSLGKVLAPAVVAFAMLNVLVIVSYAWFGLLLSGAWLAVLGVELLAIVSSTILGFAVATIVRSQQQANLAAAGYFMLLLLATGFLQPIEEAGRPIQLLSWLFPLTWSYEFLSEGMLTSADPVRATALSARLIAQIVGFSVLASVGVAFVRRRL